MPLPYFIDGDYDDYIASLKTLTHYDYDTIVPGYGDVILRGEAKEKIQSDINYLVQLGQAVDNALDSTTPNDALQAITIEACGKSRVQLNGMVVQLHQQNVKQLAQRRQKPEKL
jgi:cyclase